MCSYSDSNFNALNSLIIYTLVASYIKDLISYFYMLKLFISASLNNNLQSDVCPVYRTVSMLITLSAVDRLH